MVQLKLISFYNELSEIKMQMKTLVNLSLIFLALMLYINNAYCQKKNVLMFIVDDLRPEFGPYLDMDEAFYPDIKTPNIDQLTGDSLVLRQAYTQYSMCGPSRASFMTGRRPDTTKVISSEGEWRRDGGNFSSIPQYFKENGYITYASGKIYHKGKEDIENLYSWTEDNFIPNTSYWHQDRLSWGIAETEDYRAKPLPCQQIRDDVFMRLQSVAQQDQPFFIGAGFEKPHLPFKVPRTFYDMYPLQDMSLPAHSHVPLNHPEVAWSYWNDLISYADTEDLDNSFNQTVPDSMALELRRGYYASISYTDTLIGQVLDELSRLQLVQDTIVVLFSDHGWHLGEHSEWAKETNFELDNHVPMMIKVPGITNGGLVTEALVENVDMFSTLVDLAGLPAINRCPPDSSKILVCHEGYSMAPLLDDPDQDWKSATFSQINRNNFGGPAMGYSIHTPECVYVRWLSYYTGDDVPPNWYEVVAEELYDITNDPNQLINVAGYPKFQKVQTELEGRLQEGWRQALPQR